MSPTHPVREPKPLTLASVLGLLTLLGVSAGVGLSAGLQRSLEPPERPRPLSGVQASRRPPWSSLVFERVPVDRRRQAARKRGKAKHKRGRPHATAIMRVGEGRFHVRRRVLDRFSLDAHNRPAKGVREPGGYRVEGVVSGGVVSRLGLRDGDLVMSFDDIPLSDWGAVLQADARLRDPTVSEHLLRVRRGDTQRTLSYQLIEAGPK